MTSAISLINRYCAKLPSDAFTHLTPYCALVALGDSSSPQYYATLRLPINSPVKEEVKGEIMTSRKLAQMAVALKTCEILHKEGELDDNLLPVGKEVFRYEDEDNEWEDEVEEGQARPGTTKRKQYYIKKAAQDLQDCCPKPETECVLYELNMKLTGPITDEQNTRGRKLHAPEETSRTFGILLARQIPRVPLFPVYTRSGEVTVSIELVSTDIVVTQEQLDQLLVFHTFVFSNVLRLEKDPMEFSADPMNTSYVVVPLNCLAENPGGLCIDWDFVEHLGKRSSPVEQAKIYDAKREKFLFQTEQFQDAVVMPSYRNIDQPQYFYVAEIRHDLTPVSPFPSPDLYKTFKDYYAVKYGLVITNTEQPLLDVDHTSARLNLLTPRYMNQKGVALPTSSADTKRARRENLQQKQILIPELCDVHVFPASLWRKAVCLPAILYRTNHLLIAEDLRARIARETKIGREKIPSDFCFPKLDFGFDTNPEKIKIESVWENGTNGDMKEGTVSATSISEENPQPQVHQSSVTTILVENNFNQSNNREIPFVDLQLEVGGVQEGGDSAFSGSTPEDLDSDPGADTFNSVSTDSDSVYNTAQEGDTDMDSDEDLAGPNISDHTLVDQHIGILDNSVIVIDTAVMPLENHFQKLKIVELKDDGSVTPTAEVKCKLTEPSGVHKSDISGQESSFMIKIKQPDSSGNKSSYRDNMKQAGISEQECGYNDNKNQSDISEQDSNYMDDMKQSDISEQDSNYRDDMKQSDIRGQESICMDKIKQSDIRIEFVNTDLAKDINLCANNGVEGGAAGWEDMGTDGEAERVMSLLGPEVLQISDGVVGMICPNSRQLTNETPAATSPDKYASADNTKVEKIKPDTSLKSSPKYTFSIHSEAVCREEEDSIDTSNCATSPVHSACIVDWTSHSQNEANHVVNSAQHIKGIDSSSAQHDQVGGKGSATPSAQHSQVGVKGNASPSTQHGQVGVNGNESPCAQFGQGGINGSESPDVQHGQVGFSLSMISPTPAQCAQLRGSQLDKVDMNKDKTCLISSIVNPVKSVEVSLTAPKEAPPREDPVGIGVWGENVQSVMPTNSSVTNTERVVSLDKDVNLSTFLGPSPCTILQALTMSNANDFFSLERLETIGDSFLKYAITIYLYCTYPGIHEGKLSYLRSKQVSNYNLYRLGKKKGLPESMVSAKFEPNDNWLPSGYVINEGKRRGPVPKVLISSCAVRDKSTAATAPIRVEERSSEDSGSGDSGSIRISCNHRSNGNLSRSSRMANMQQLKFKQELEEVSRCQEVENRADQLDTAKQLLPYNLRTQQIIPDKSVADTVEALIGCYLTSCGKRGALLFMSWLGLRVFPKKDGYPDSVPEEVNNEFEELQVPRSPQLGHVCNGDTVVNRLLDGYDAFEEKISYKFKDRSYLLQAFTHASYHYNTVTDCYQRLEFLGDAILDYVITRHLFEDSRRYSPGVLTDLRSALVNNNIFAALAVKWDFHKYFKAVSPALFYVIERFVSRQKDNEDVIELDDDEDDSDDMEKVEMEIPKALGDIFESVAGAIYLDSAMSLDTVWRVYYRMMKPQIDQYLERIPKSPVRELLEMEPETAKFEKPERTMEGKIRVTVNVVGKGVFTGVGRNYRIAKSAAAKKALKNIKTMQAQGLI
ncbi:endoribonuclease Dicer-like isoform X2 [Liolophura sinensis]